MYVNKKRAATAKVKKEDKKTEEKKEEEKQEESKPK